MRPIIPNQLITFPQQQLVQCVKYYIGFTLENHGDELRYFLSRGVDDPATIVDTHISDCGLFALAVWLEVGIRDEKLSEKYQTGKAIEWLVEITNRHNATRHIRDDIPTVGALLHYHTHGKNDDHVEFLLSPPTIGQWIANHAGGGRANCGIGEGTSNILWNLGRPLQAWYDINALCGV